MKFHKYQGAGNDFIMINMLHGEQLPNKKQMAFLCDRHFGIGGDGVIAIFPSMVADYQMRIFNADGTEPQMCGNGLRCFAAYLFHQKIITTTSVTVETGAGIKTCLLEDGGNCVTINMGAVFFEAETLFPHENIQKPGVNGIPFTAVSTGNPHMIVFTEKCLSLDEIVSRGTIYGKEPFFKEGTNVSFCFPENKQSGKLMVYERGVGLTLACGTGACATAAAGVKSGYFNSDQFIDLTLPGGVLSIFISSDFKIVKLKGPAKAVFSGEITAF